MTVDIAVDAGAALGECPLWSPAEAVLWWVDIDGCAIHRYDPGTGRDERRELPGRPGSIALTAEPGRLLVASEHRLGWFRWSDGSFEPWIDLEAPGTGNRLNDGRTDPAGRLWVGSMYEHPGAERFTGMLHRVEADGTATTVKEHVGIPNSLAFAPDGRTMYWADTLRGTVLAHDYDPGTGEAGEPHPLFDFAAIDGWPDGACVDVDGCLWVACVWGGAIARFTPYGRLDRTIPLPVDAPTMPAFGGPDLATMFVTSIGRRAAGSPQPGSGAAAGALLAVDAGVAGLADAPFAGSPR